MKRLLPKTANNPRGFTLVELMVVITILAVLALIGFTAFQEAQKRARDGRRIAEVDSIAKALEIHYANDDPDGGAALLPGYQPLVTTWFDQGGVPLDPRGNTYCLYTNTAQITAKPVAWTGATCPSIGSVSGATAAVGSPTSGTKFWAVCSSSELNSQVYCKFSQQ